MRFASFDWDGSDARALATELRALQPPLGEVGEDVAAIIEDVRQRGDVAVMEAEETFGGTRPSDLLVAAEAPAEALAGAGELRPALESAAEAIRAVAVAEAAAEAPTSTEATFGQRIEMRSVPVEAAGAYVPGGSAAYPSSVLMCCIAARAAGVERVGVASPTGPDGAPAPSVLAACAIAEADQVYAMGGAQAIAALALGTESVDPVDVVVGPGNRYVQEAKRRLYGTVGIEGIAGPSELMVIADQGADLSALALDICAQGEHGADGLLVAAAGERVVLDAIRAEIERLEGEAGRRASEAPLALVRVPSPRGAVELADALAPEHLELAVSDAESLAAEVRYAGCVFVGESGATAFGDYAAGSNHVLPTGGAGRFSGPLGPRAFRRRIATVRVPAEATGKLAAVTDTLARAEGFPIHGESALARSATPARRESDG